MLSELSALYHDDHLLGERLILQFQSDAWTRVNCKNKDIYVMSIHKY